MNFFIYNFLIYLFYLFIFSISISIYLSIYLSLSIYNVSSVSCFRGRCVTCQILVFHCPPCLMFSCHVTQDNQSCIKLSENPVFQDRSKHIEIRYHFIGDSVQRGIVKLQFISTDEQVVLMIQQLQKIFYCYYILHKP